MQCFQVEDQDPLIREYHDVPFDFKVINEDIRVLLKRKVKKRFRYMSRPEEVEKEIINEH